MITIASYPRSGSTYLRFILCNIFYPNIEHDFNTVNALIPTIESEAEVNMHSPDARIFYKTHEKRNFVSAYLIRHVGDTLISEYYYQKKFYNITKTLEEWMEEDDYGNHWRDFVNHYFGCYVIKYETLVESPAFAVDDLLLKLGYHSIDAQSDDAVRKCDIAKIRELEKSAGFPNQEQPFVRDGSVGQLESLSVEIKSKILAKNKRELILLNYL